MRTDTTRDPWVIVTITANRPQIFQDEEGRTYGHIGKRQFSIRNYSDRFKATWQFYRSLSKDLWVKEQALAMEAKSIQDSSSKGLAPKSRAPFQPTTTKPE